MHIRGHHETIFWRLFLATFWLSLPNGICKARSIGDRWAGCRSQPCIWFWLARCWACSLIEIYLYFYIRRIVLSASHLWLLCLLHDLWHRKRTLRPMLWPHGDGIGSETSRFRMKIALACQCGREYCLSFFARLLWQFGCCFSDLSSLLKIIVELQCLFSADHL